MVFVFWIIFVALVAGYAESRGRSGLLWGLIALVFSPLLAFVIVALLPENK